MTNYIYIILALALLLYYLSYKEPFIGGYVNSRLNKNNRYFREKWNQLGTNVGSMVKKVKRIGK